MQKKITLSASPSNSFAGDHSTKHGEKIRLAEKPLMFVIASILFIIFTIYTYFVAREYLVQFDFDTTVRLHDNIPERVDPFFSTLSLLGSFEITAGIFLLLLTVVSIKRRRRLVLGIMFTVFHVVEVAFKTIVDQVGPPFMFHRYSFDYHFPSAYVSTDFYSYPSGHVGRTAMLVFILGFIVWKSRLNLSSKLILWGGLGMVYAVMFVSRITLGEHWVSDTIGGTLLGVSMAAFGLLFW